MYLCQNTIIQETDLTPPSSLVRKDQLRRKRREKKEEKKRRTGREQATAYIGVQRASLLPRNEKDGEGATHMLSLTLSAT